MSMLLPVSSLAREPLHILYTWDFLRFSKWLRLTCVLKALKPCLVANSDALCSRAHWLALPSIRKKTVLGTVPRRTQEQSNRLQLPVSLVFPEKLCQKQSWFYPSHTRRPKLQYIFTLRLVVKKSLAKFSRPSCDDCWPFPQSCRSFSTGLQGF